MSFTGFLHLIDPIRSSELRPIRPTVAVEKLAALRATAISEPISRFDRLGDLPAELRLLIIKHVLFPTEASFSVEIGKIPNQPLFGVSKLMRTEAIRLYRENVTVVAFVVMEHSYMDVLAPEHRGAFKNLNKAAVLKDKVKHLQDGPLPIPSFSKIVLHISDVDHCRLFQMTIKVARTLTGFEVEPYLTVLPSSATRLGWLEIAAVERLPVAWKPHMDDMLGRSGGYGFNTREIELLAGMLHICYVKDKFTPEPRLVSFGGDDIQGHYWKGKEVDMTISPHEDFGNPRACQPRPSESATLAEHWQDVDADGEDDDDISEGDGHHDDGVDDEGGSMGHESDEDDVIQDAYPLSLLTPEIDLPELPDPKFPDLEGSLSMSEFF